MLDSGNLPDDQFGFSAYALVAMADAHQVNLISAARAEIGSLRISIPAHVTVRGTFSSIPDLGSLRDQLRSTAATQEPAEIRFPADGWTARERSEGLFTVRMACEKSDGWLQLHRAFDAVIRPQSVNNYPDRYGPHLTLAEECDAERVKLALSIGANLDIGTGFMARTVHLMGRAGNAYDGTWKGIETFPLGA